MRWLAHHFEEGGWGMYPLLWCATIALGIGLGRAIHLRGPRVRVDEVIDELDRLLRRGDVAAAVAMALRIPGPSGRVLLAGLRESLQRSERIEAAIATSLMLELAPLARGRGGLWLCAQLGTLLGLLGTITGMIVPHCGNADASSRATMLARAISEAMNCTALGLFVSALAILLALVTDARERALREELALLALATRNRLLTHRERLVWLGARAPIERATYRAAA